jgi:hypothetical protein
MTVETRKKSLSELYALLDEHDKNEPIKPKLCGLEIMSEATPEGIVKHCSETQVKNLGIFTAEAHGLFGQGNKNKPYTMNDIWSGVIQTRHLATQKKQKIELSGSLVGFMQPEIGDKIFRGNDRLRNSGFLARCLFCFVYSNQGYRPYFNINDNCLEEDVFDNKIICLLNKSVKNNLVGDENFVVLELDEAAKFEWISFYTNTEASMCEGRRYAGFKDHASKLPENVLRVAAVIHGINYGFNGKITLETLRQSISICEYYSDNFITAFTEPPQEVIDAQKLEDWLIKKRNNNVRYIRKSFVLTHGPVKPASRVDIALSMLVGKEVLSVNVYVKQGPKGRSTKPLNVIDLHPNWIPDNYQLSSIINSTVGCGI